MKVTTEEARVIADYLCNRLALSTYAAQVAALAKERDELRWSLEAAERRIATLQGMLDK